MQSLGEHDRGTHFGWADSWKNDIASGTEQRVGISQAKGVRRQMQGRKAREEHSRQMRDTEHF